MEISCINGMEYDYEPRKNELLYIQRGVTFPMVIEAIHERGILLNFDHPHQNKYPGQKILVVDLNGYAYCVPYEEKGSTRRLKTIYPNGKFKYLIEGEE